MIIRALMLMCLLLRVPVQTQNTPFRFIGISDMHISDSTALRNFRALLYTLKKTENADFVVMTGDICGNAPEFLPRIKNIMDNSELKAYDLAGNHDDNYARNPEWYLPVFGRFRYSFSHKGCAVVMNWSQEQDTTWIIRTLDSIGNSTPVIFCQHYPISLPESGILNGRNNIRLTLNGHVHGFGNIVSNGRTSVTIPSCFLDDKQTAYSYCVFDVTDSGKTAVQLKYLTKSNLQFPIDKPPSVAMLPVSDTAALKGIVQFSGSASDDNGVSKVEFSVDYGVWKPVTGLSNWNYSLDTRTLTDGNHLFSVRAIDNKGQECTEYGSWIGVVQNAPPNPHIHSFQQGANLYKGCTNASVSKQYLSTDDLECWIWGGGASEFNEFYIRFDLSSDAALKGKYVKEAKLTLYCNRENFESILGTLKAKFIVGVLKESWDETMTWTTRPVYPGWTGSLTYTVPEDMKADWPKFTGRWMNPPQEVVVDLTPILPKIKEWIDSPSTNFGLVFSPLYGTQYNFSALRNNHSVVSLRPKFTIETSDTPVVAENNKKLSTLEFGISPNPFSSEIIIHAYYGNGTAAVYDLTGKCISVIKFIKNKPLLWNTGHLATGMYVVKAVSDRKKFEKRIILVR
ncbi:MAG: DNRLRE domain-containing protein [Fibrobacteres bacterium]|nr:DNRLRE domain-containing protein [Fibrobacterota bacterium]